MLRSCSIRPLASVLAAAKARTLPTEHILSSNFSQHQHDDAAYDRPLMRHTPTAIDLPDKLQPGQMIVRNSFLGLNTLDQSLWDEFDPRRSPVQTQEGSGMVMKCGPNVDPSAWMGKRVAFFKSIGGSYSSFSVADTSDLFLIPDGVSDETAAAVMLQGCTAHYLSHDCFNCRPGTTVVVHSAAGGTGILLSQLAKLRGSTVIGLCGKHKGKVAKEIGLCDHVFELTPRRRWVDDVRSVAPDGVDAVFDGCGKSTFEGSLSVLKRRGSMISFGNATGVVPPISPLKLTEHGSMSLQRPTLRDYANKETGEIDGRVRDLFDAIKSGKLKAVIGSIFPIERRDEGEELLRAGTSLGKVLVKC